VGLTTRRHASGEIDWTGRISKCGDAMLRSHLFEAAGVLLTRVPKWSALKAWGDEARQAKWAPKGHSRRPAQARGHSAADVDRPNRVQLVEEGGCRVTSNTEIKGSRSTARKHVPAGTMAVVRSPDFLRALNQRDYACNIDPPASSYAIMRRAGLSLPKTLSIDSQTPTNQNMIAE